MVSWSRLARRGRREAPNRAAPTLHSGQCRGLAIPKTVQQVVELRTSKLGFPLGGELAHRSRDDAPDDFSRSIPVAVGNAAAAFANLVLPLGIGGPIEREVGVREIGSGA